MTSKKYSFIVVGILILAAATAGAWYFLSLENKTGKECIQVITDARNPATGEIKTFPTPCNVPAGWDRLETDHEQFTKGAETWSRYRNDDLGIRFEYRLEPNGYLLIEEATTSVPQKDIVKFLSLFNKKEYVELKASNIPREFPPAISVLIYKNPYNYSPRQWVLKENRISGVDIANSVVSDYEISGVPAVRYSTDALYPTDIIVALNNGLIYYISGSYITVDSLIRKDFLDMLKTMALY